MPQPIGSDGNAPPMAEWSIEDSLKDEAPEGEVSYHGFLVSELKPWGMGIMSPHCRHMGLLALRPGDSLTILTDICRRFVPSPEGDSGLVAFVSRHFRAGLWIVPPPNGA